MWTTLRINSYALASVRARSDGIFYLRDLGRANGKLRSLLLSFYFIFLFLFYFFFYLFSFYSFLSLFFFSFFLFVFVFFCFFFLFFSLAAQDDTRHLRYKNAPSFTTQRIGIYYRMEHSKASAISTEHKTCCSYPVDGLLWYTSPSLLPVSLSLFFPHKRVGCRLLQRKLSMVGETHCEQCPEKYFSYHIVLFCWHSTTASAIGLMYQVCLLCRAD